MKRIGVIFAFLSIFSSVKLYSYNAEISNLDGRDAVFRWLQEQLVINQAYFRSLSCSSVDYEVSNVPILKAVRYELKDNESLEKISSILKTDKSSLWSANKIDGDDSPKRAGDIIFIPTVKGIVIKIDEDGHSFTSLGKDYGFPGVVIKSLNRYSRENLIPQDEILIPYTGSDGQIGCRQMLGFLPPLDSGRLTSTFGFRIDPFLRSHRFHAGIDVAAPQGTPVYAIQSGKVIEAGFRAGYGNFIAIRHNRGYTSRYAHLQYIFVRKGDQLSPRQKIGTVGSSGRSTGPHLHLEVRLWSTPHDPLRLLRSSGWRYHIRRHISSGRR